MTAIDANGVSQIAEASAARPWKIGSWATADCGAGGRPGPLGVPPMACEIIGLPFPAAISWLGASASCITDISMHFGVFAGLHGWRVRHNIGDRDSELRRNIALRAVFGEMGMITGMSNRQLRLRGSCP